jgi:hypothetical protein
VTESVKSSVRLLGLGLDDVRNKLEIFRYNAIHKVALSLENTVQRKHLLHDFGVKNGSFECKLCECGMFYHFRAEEYRNSIGK